MRELFEITQPENPMEAARRGARPILRRRFYENAAVAETPQGYALQLDGKPVHTPARRVLCAPNAAIAQKIAAEWNAQTDVIDPAKMPLTRLANAIIDGVADAPAPVAAEIEKYLGSDMLFYRAGAPNGLVERQAEAPRRVEYSLTDLGRTLVEPIEVLTNWARDYGGAIADFQEAADVTTAARTRTAG